jgi:cytoskeletal protein CcmA (bactofilin family)
VKKERKADSITTFLGADSHLEGSIEFQGTIRVDGKVNGKISSNSVAVAVIMGEVDGTIDAKDRIEVYPPGRVSGEIQAPVISIEPGGILNGNCIMKTSAASSSKSSNKSKIHPVALDSKGK